MREEENRPTVDSILKLNRQKPVVNLFQVDTTIVLLTHATLERIFGNPLIPQKPLIEQ